MSTSTNATASESDAKAFTIFAVYRESGQRYATSLEAADPGEAEDLAQEQCRADNGFSEGEEPLLIAGVAAGEIAALDSDPFIG